MNLLQFWHVTIQITAVHLPKLAWLNLLLTLCMTLVHIYPPCFSVFCIYFLSLAVRNQPPLCSLFGETALPILNLFNLLYIYYTHAENVLFFS